MKIPYSIIVFAIVVLAFGIVVGSPPDRHGFHSAFLGGGLYEDGESEDSSDDGSESGDSSDSGVSSEPVEFAEAKIFFEFNSTDLDLGTHIFFDAVGWNEVEVIGPDGTIFEVENGGGLGVIGSTEVFTESAEPPLDEENLEAEMAAFFARFPEGEYEFEGVTVDGRELEGSATLSHALPAAPEMIFPDPEAEENLADPDDMLVIWVDASGPGDPEIERYEVVVEFEDEVSESVFTYVVEVPADPGAGLQSLPVPPEWFESLEAFDGEFKAEIVAIAANRNATIVELEFELDD